MRIENFRDGQGRGNILCEFDIVLEDSWGTVYHNWRLIRGKTGSRFISGPSYGVNTDNGTKKFCPFIEMKREKKAEFEDAVMKELQHFRLKE